MLTASHLYQHLSCPRWPWNEWFGNPREKRGPSAFLRKLLADGVQFEESIYADLQPARVSYPPGDHGAGMAETLRLMRAGTPLIAQGVLRSGERVGVPDLLERRPGRSALGDHLYEPIEIKTARSVKPAYRLQLAFYSHLLAEHQGAWPEHAHVILHDGTRETFALETVRAHYDRVLHALDDTMAGREPPIHVCSTCAECPWELTCLARAEQARDVSLTYGMQRRVAHALRRNGVGTLPGLAALEPGRVVEWTGLTPAAARQMVSQAQVLERREVAWRRAATFPDSEADVYFDIEGDPEHDVMYLFGVLVRRADGSEDYRPFVAEDPEHEGRAFGELLDWLDTVPDAPVYHYHHYERSALRALADKHRVPPARVAAVLARMHDLNRDLTETAVLPVYSYSLKAVARFLGYHWSHPEASAAQSMFWYSSWLKSGDRRFLDLAVEYNADDCRATRVLKEWLAAGPELASEFAPVGEGYLGPRGPRAAR